MKKFFTSIVLLSAVVVATAQPTLPGVPAACNANNCTSNSNIDVCPPGGSIVVSSHSGGVYNRGNNSNHLGAGAIWRYRNFATVGGVTVNCEVTIDAVVNASLENIDDDAAVDQGGNSIASFFAPRIGADQNLSGTDRRGYVQFTMMFYKNATGVNNNTNSDFANSITLTAMNFVHYDIDGNDAGGVARGTAGSWFRETGLAKRISAGNPMVLASGTSDLSAYNYTDGGNSWTGFAGSICERDGVSRCAQVASSFSYTGSYPSITVRMGYDYNAGDNIGRPVRQYGSRLGCFNFPQQVTLPVKLLGFSGSLNANKTLLNWETANEVNFDHYEVERSVNGSDFIIVGTQASKNSGAAKLSYQYTDDLSGTYENAYYYRLRMVDIDGKFSYSNVIVVRKDQKNVAGMILSPNPVYNGSAVTIRLNSDRKKNIEIRVFDNSGKMVMKQQNQLTEGINSISFNNQGRLLSGVYTVQVVSDEEILSSKLSVIR